MKAAKRIGEIVCILTAVFFMLAMDSQGIQAEETDMLRRLNPWETESAGGNYFQYVSHEGNDWRIEQKDNEAYIDLGDSDIRAQQCYYEIHFEGNGITVFANKNSNHGQVRYAVDGEQEKLEDLYSAFRTEPQEVYSVSGLTEGPHVLTAVTMVTKNPNSSSIVNQVAYAEISYKGTPILGGTIEDADSQFTQDRYPEMTEKQNVSASLTAWKNDKAVSELVLYSKNSSLKNVKITAGALKNDRDVIDAGHITTTFLKSAKAYNGGRAWGSLPEETAENRSESSEILYQKGGAVDIPYNSLQPVWVEFAIPKNAKAGTYTGNLTVAAEGLEEPLVFTYTITVQNLTLPDADAFADTFDIELWQYPYSSAEYYGVEPFSPKHLAIMRSSMQKYKEIGGHAITTTIVEEAWNGQTYSENEIHYPSMVRWTKQKDGGFAYDYTDFDAWVTFCKSMGLGDKIVLYSIAPWHSAFPYWEDGILKTESFDDVGADGYQTMWTDFLTDLIRHLEEKGWFEESYIGIDEQGFSERAFDLINSVKNSEGKSLKTAGAMDSFVEKKDLAMRVDDLNVGDNAASGHPEEFRELLEARAAAGLRTTLYSCTGHAPGNFSLSSPAESYWSIINAGKMGTAGFLRWAYDAWVEDPLRDTTHSLFEPGDCFLIYPDEKDAENPESKSSVRLERMAEGVRDVNKLKLMQEKMPSLTEEIEALYAGISTAAGGGSYLPETAKKQLSAEMRAFKAGIDSISEKFAETMGDPEETEEPDHREEEPDHTEKDPQISVTPSVKENGIYLADGLYYRVISLDKQTVSVVKAGQKMSKKLVIGGQVIIQNKTFTVTEIGKSAFAKNSYITGVTIGKTIKKIGNKAFFKCKKLKKVTIKSKKLNGVGKKAFQGIHRKAVIKVPAGKYRKYKNFLVKKGQGEFPCVLW